MICNDIDDYLISMWRSAQNGYVFPDTITKEEYEYIKNNKDIDKTLTAFVGFGCSYGGRWFQGYAKNNKGYNYALAAKTSISNDIKYLKANVDFENMDYRQIILPDNSVIYCDPPYINTKKYITHQNFNTNEFWGYMRTISKNHLVIISELEAPDDFVSIWKKQKKRTLDVNKQNQFIVTEKLFIHKDTYNKLYKI